MLFNSFEYLIFLPIVVIFYNLFRGKFKNIFLLLASLTFYSFWNVKYTFLMVLSILITYMTGIYIENNRDSKAKMKLAVFLCFFINLGILFIFKYFNFFMDLAGKISGGNFNIALDLLLPVGISFYTFQALGYTIDVYRKDLEAERSLIDYALFVSFFPQLVAGPIERSRNLLPQIKNPKKFSYENLIRGLQLFFYGMFLKLLLADRAAIFVNDAFANYKTYSRSFLIIGAFLFTLQIYCDFYSYSIMAKGSAKILGIDLMDNFKEPLLSKSITEFWRRWHISLSTWFKDYLYIPLGGNRKGSFRKCLNLLIVFLVSGLWHGAELSFVLWGLIHGVFNVIESLLGINKSKKSSIFLDFFRRILTLLIVVFAFIYFRAETIHQGNDYILGIINNPWSKNLLEEITNSKFGLANLYPLGVGIFILLVFDILKYNRINLGENLIRLVLPIRWIIYLAFILGIIIFGIYGPEFSESAFIYFQF
ncbi:MBOAT family O-acyltransferase [Peptoniphilus harei]|uniref:MBOAT family O-acyltransferase n=1 Tax=Peptoniphilus harei TaxID=54005 RepID=UPI0029074179|nr:MBOAT family O-acyltransferase [Peptoniphilus harei]MDU5417969.1 MBOAT family O-acyltransferase [Peptoniphilus harei]